MNNSATNLFWTRNAVITETIESIYILGIPHFSSAQCFAEIAASYETLTPLFTALCRCNSHVSLISNLDIMFVLLKKA